MELSGAEKTSPSSGAMAASAPMSGEAFLDGMNAGHTWTRTLPDGTELGLRKAFPLDTKMLGRFMNSVSPQSLMLRLGTSIVAPATIDSFTKSPTVTTLLPSIDGKLVGLANICATEKPGVCEMAWLIHQDFQGQKIGKTLLKDMYGIARAQGFKEIENLVAKNNGVMLDWSRKQPGFISIKPKDYQWHEVSLSLEHEGAEMERPAAMRAYARPPEEAGEEIERATAPTVSDEDAARIAEQHARDEEELGY